MSSLSVTSGQTITTSTDVGGTDVVDVASGGTISVGSGNLGIDWTANATGGGVQIENDAGGVITQTGTGSAIGATGSSLTGTLTITNGGTISATAGVPAINLISTGASTAETVTNSGIITSASGFALLMGSGTDVFNVVTGSSTLGRVIAASGTGTINLSGSGSGTIYGSSEGINPTTKVAAFAGWDGFSTVNVNSGTWTLEGGGYYNSLNVAAGATFVIHANLPQDATATPNGTPGDDGIGPLAFTPNPIGPAGSTTLTVVNNGTIDLTGDDNFFGYDPASSAALAYSGSGQINYQGTGANYITPNETYAVTGGVSESNGVVYVLGTINATTTINAGGTVQIGGGGTLASQSSSYVDTGLTGAVNGAIVDNGTLKVARLDSYTLGAALTGSGVLQKLAAGTLTLQSSTNFSGHVLADQGTLDLAGAIATSQASTAAVSSSGLANGAATIANAGSVSSQTGAAVDMSAATGNVTLSNSGTLSGDTSLSPGAQVAVVMSNHVDTFTNSGTVNGAVHLGDGSSSHITNTGAINGAVVLGSAGADVYDGRGGTLTGGVTLGGGADTVYLGNDGETVRGGTGTATIYGGNGTDTITGGSGADLISVHAGNDVLTGGGGADTFAFTPGIGYETVTDFSLAQGDVIDLTAFQTLLTFQNVQADMTQVGSNTVISLPGGGTVTLDGVSMSALTAADFHLTPPATTVTGTSANDFTATFEGVLQQYTLGAEGSAVTGGPENANDALVNINRIQFVDGYEAYSTSDTAAEVYRLYEATLNRAPDQEGLTYWANQLNSGASLQTVANGFVTSSEFQADYGSLTNTQFVTQLYENVLHRAPDSGGLTYWLGQMSSGMTQAQVVLGFTQSPEDISDLAGPVQQGLWVGNENAAEVARLYDTTLNRLPDVAGLAYWTNQLQTGTSLQTVVNGFVGSPEFQADYGALNNTQFVTQLYENTLHRAPDTAGLNYWVGELSSSAMTRAQVVLGFSDSPEHITDTAPHIDGGIWVV